MKLTKVEINNLFQHEHIEQDLTGHLIGIVGTNGCGKSNFLNAIHYAFAGEVPGKVKEKLLRWGADVGNVKVDFDFNGTACSIDRSVGKNSVTFWFGKTKYTGTTKVAAAILDHLGLDKDVLRMVFVKQAELDAVLFEAASKRETAFQRMCGIGEATRVHKKIGEVLGDNFPPLPDYGEQIAVAKEELATQEDQLGELEKFEKDMLAFLAQNDKDQLVQDKLTYQSLVQSIKSAIDTAQQMAMSMKAIGADQHSIDEIDKQLGGATLEAVDEEILTTQKRLESAKEYKRLYTAFIKKREELAEIGTPPCTPEELEELKKHAELVKNELLDISGSMALYEKLLESLKAHEADMTQCPMCGSDIQDLQILKQRVSQELMLCEQRKAKINTNAESRHVELSGEHQVYLAKSELLQKQVEEANTMLQAADAVEENIPKLEADLAGMSSVRVDLNRLVQKRDQANTRISLQQQQYLDLEAKHQEHVKVVNSAPQTKDLDMELDTMLEHVSERSVSVENALAGVHQHEVRLGNIRGSISVLKTNKAKLEKTIDQIKEKRDQQGLYKEVVGTIENVRDWFHYKNGPHDLAVSVLDELTEDVNKYLLELNAPFSVAAEDTALAYKCYFNDGRTVPTDVTPEASDLSGGQKIMLAIAFRFASYCMFANKQGVLSLDEPTVYLDEHNVGNFCTLLSKIREVAEKLDLQIFISTHERAVIPKLDAVIDLSPQTKEIEAIAV